MGEVHFIKGGLKQFNPRFLEWDKPKDREVDGKTVKGRPTRGFGNREFEYAGKLMTPEPWDNHPDVWDILVEANRITKNIFSNFDSYNFCLVGLYRDGSDSIPFHTDTVPTEKSFVFSASFGATRLFEWREYECDIKDHSNTSSLNISRDALGKSGYYYETKRWLLEHGDVIIFDGESQMNSEHAVPELQGEKNKRINLTFRSGL
jgi:alkylated DNA repair dioxygenase AlkB